MAAAGLVVLVWASVSGPVAVFGSAGPRMAPTAEPTPSASPTPEPDLPPSGRELFGDRTPQLDLSWVGDLLAWTILLGLLGLAVLVGRWLWRHRWRLPERPGEVDFEVLPTVQAATARLARDAAARLSAVGQGTPRDGILRCWLRLEQVVAEAGFPREPWETSAEFTVRVLRSLDVDPRSIGVLADLYREARFSSHTLGEAARTTAADALRRFQDDLLLASR